MKIKEIAEQAKCSKSRVYQLKNFLNRVPTVEEVVQRKGKRGRPYKYELSEQENKDN